MLAHLDSILQVPIQFQIQEGQFDDPEEDGEGQSQHHAAAEENE